MVSYIKTVEPGNWQLQTQEPQPEYTHTTGMLEAGIASTKHFVNKGVYQRDSGTHAEMDPDFYADIASRLGGDRLSVLQPHVRQPGIDFGR